MKIIDPHLHLFDLSQGEYSWLKPECPPFWSDKPLIAKNFSENDLTLAKPLTLAGFVHIEAGFDNQQPWREIAWLESTCKIPFRSIALLDITLPKALFLTQLESLMTYQSVVGVRYILDDDALTILNNKNSAVNLAILAAKKLSFELQMPLTNNTAVERLITILSSNTDLQVCINHAGWPAQDNAQSLCWLQNLKRLASFDNVFVKCSGFEMANRHYSANWAGKIIHQCIESFGIYRVMLASNFPLSLFHTSYENTWNSYLSIGSNNLGENEPADIKPLYSKGQLTQLCFSNAQRFYQF